MKVTKTDELDPTLAASPLYQKRIKEEQELLKKDIKNMTTAERIKLRTYNQRFTIPLRDGKDIIKIEMRMWTKRDMVLFDQTFPYMDEPTKRGEEAFTFVCNFLARVCIDESLDFAFWNSGDWGLQTFYELRHHMQEAIAKAVVDARDFRK